MAHPLGSLPLVCAQDALSEFFEPGLLKITFSSATLKIT